ncbi:MAG: helix-turn-helix domain-containing protein [Candidatus Thiothrix putei]|uniref:Helix-turn-helix domain-containing protein n=1 Tax=Candidatus Thiothrix putei TaxID=3080811 RepID=A0AA95HGJ6_9GAMM|nr:MAG: helix-turn-helix domain-containing protein [Candidatus Thiothrix putei]
MPITVSTPQEIGRLVRAARKAQGLRQDDAAGAIGVSDMFLSGLENGAPGVRLDKLLKVLHGLGLVLQVNVTDDVAKRYATLQRTTTAKS